MFIKRVRYSKIGKTSYLSNRLKVALNPAVFIKKRLIYCLSSSNDAVSIRKIQVEAHGLLPDPIYPVTEAILKHQKDLFSDVYYLSEQKISVKGAAAGKKIWKCKRNAT